MRNQKAIIVLIVVLFAGVLPWQAMISGGAENSGEMRKINELAPQMKATCDLEGRAKKLGPSVGPMISRNILFSETGCKADNLTYWSPREPFPSFGLMHAIWLPRRASRDFDEAFPRLWKFLREKNNNRYPIPEFLNKNDIGAAPWRSKEEFDQAAEVRDLNRFLVTPEVLGWQGEFAIQRGLESAYKILAANQLDDRPEKLTNEKLCDYFQKLLATPLGALAIVDYANFKGEGIDPKEPVGPSRVRYGLKQVLEGLDKVTLTLEQQNRAKVIKDVEQREQYLLRQKFANSAKAALQRRVDAYPTERERKLFAVNIGPWNNRIDRSYQNEGIDPNQCPLFSTPAAPPEIPQLPAGSVN